MQNAKYKLSKLSNSAGKPITNFKTGQLAMLWRQRNRPGRTTGNWVGPVRVLLQEGGTIWVATGATLIRARHNQLRSCTRREEMDAMLEGTSVLSTPVTVESLMRHFTGRHYQNVTGEVPSLRQQQADLEGAEVVVESRRTATLDSWKIEEISGKKWMVRVHNAPRITMFIPSRTGQAPLDDDDLTGKRITQVKPMVDGARMVEIEDDFKVGANPQRQLQERWQGATRFEIPEDVTVNDDEQVLPDVPVLHPQTTALIPGSAVADGVPSTPRGPTPGDYPLCSTPECHLRGGHIGPHEDENNKKFSYEPHSGRVDLEAEDDMGSSSSSSSTSSSSSSDSELLPDEPTSKKRRTENEDDDDLLYQLEVPVSEADVHFLANHPGKAVIWMSKKMEAKGRELHWTKMPLKMKRGFDEAQAREISQVITSKALRSLTAQEHMNLDAKKVMQMRWVLTLKEGPEGTKEKARLVVLGYQAHNLTKVQASAPSMCRLSRNLLLAICANNRFTLLSGDVSSAFLQAEESLDHEELNVWAPPEVAVAFGADPKYPVLPLRIRKAFYGLVHAPRRWFDDVAKTLTSQGWQQSLADRCIFFMMDGDKLVAMAGLHVDDFLVGGDFTNKKFTDAMDQLKKSYRWGRWDQGSFEFAGCDIKQHSDGSITVSQETYVGKWLDEIEISQERSAQKNSPLTSEEVSRLRGAIGTMSWKASQTGPQYAADVGLLLSEVPHATIETIIKTNKLIREVRRDAQQSLRFPAWNVDWKQLSVLTWADASNHNRVDKSSTMGIISALAPSEVLHGGECEMAILNWRSSKTMRQCLGSNGAEVQAITEGEDATFRIRALLAEFHGVVFEDKYDMYNKVKELTSGAVIMDSRGIYDAMTRNVSALHGLRSSRAGYELTLSVNQAMKIGTHMRWVCGTAQLADSLTKSNSRKAILQMLCNGQRWKLIHDPDFVAGRKLKKQEMLKHLREQETVFFSKIAEWAKQNRWPWQDSLEESRSMGDEMITIPIKTNQMDSS
eukprot:Skav207449  [mRNA]  locus=scaffold3545:28907:32044:+ [translate_table: standard]